MCDVASMAEDPQFPHERLAWARERAGYSDKAEFAKALGINPVTYRAYESGQNGFAKLAAQFAKKLGVSAEWLLEGGRLPAGEPPTRQADIPPTRSADGGETVAVMRMDLSYAMGPGTDIDHDYIEGEPVVLDLAFLRRLTPSAPNMIRIVNGVGDSMFPTIHDSEDLVLDLGQRTLNLQDRIWALSLFGVGAVKRLKAIGRDRVLVISDNPDVPDQEVEVSDVMLVGRIVGSIRRH